MAKHQTDLQVALVERAPGVVCATLFGGMELPKHTPFSVYKHRKHELYAVHGESETLDYNGVADAGTPTDTYLAVYDPSAKSVVLQRAVVVAATVTAKSKRVLHGPKVRALGSRHMDQRNALGEAFGTKKARKAIADLERNRVDASKLVDAELDIVDAVKLSTAALPTREAMTAQAEEQRPGPECNPSATRVEDVYHIDGIIPPQERALIRVGPILAETDAEARAKMLPYAGSKLLTTRLAGIVQEEQRPRLEVLYYALFLFGVYVHRRARLKLELLERLGNPPEVLVDGALERFALSRGGAVGRSKDRGFVIDPQGEDRLLSHLLCLVWHLDGFRAEVAPLAQELSLKPLRLVGLFRTLGATIKSASGAEAEAFGISKAAAAGYKIASLKVPFKMPEMSRKRMRAR